jgi:GTP-binding protein YchF
VAANYPFATIEPNVGVVPLPDPRLDVLAGIFESKQIVPAAVSFVDIAGIVKGASEGEGLGNKFLANIREADAICQVVRVFADDDVIHVSGAVDPADDIEVVQTELMLADLQTIEKAVPRIEKEIKGKKTEPKVLAAVLAAQKLLEDGTTLFSGAEAAGIDVSLLRELSLMTAKPFIYVFNVDEDGLTDTDRQAELRALVAPADAVFLNAKLEAELLELEDDDAAELLASVGQTEPGMNQLARVGFHTLGLQTFLTAGPMESRAWTIHQGWTAPQAAGVIHTDFERGFIKAEVVGYDEIVDAGSMAEAKARGKVRIEGKDYVMADGDVVEFRFNV